MHTTTTSLCLYSALPTASPETSFQPNVTNHWRSKPCRSFTDSVQISPASDCTKPRPWLFLGPVLLKGSFHTCTLADHSS